MLGVDLQNASAVIVGLRLERMEVLLHLEAHAAVGHHGHGMRAEVAGNANLLDLLAQRVLHKGQCVLEALRAFLIGLLFLVGRKLEVVGENVAELMLVVLLKRLRDELIHLLGQKQHVKAAVAQHTRLRQAGQVLDAAARSEVNMLLRLGHGCAVLLERHELALLDGVELDQILQQLLMCAEFRYYAELELTAEGRIELFVLLAVVFQHLFQLGLDLLFQIAGDEFQLARMLEHLTADVQAQILRIDHAAHETEMLRQQVSAVFHNQHTGGIELQAGLVVLGIEIIGRLGRDIEQRLIRHRALDGQMDDTQRLFKIIELLTVEAVILLLGDVLFVLLPDRNHGIERLHLADGLIFGLVGVLGLLGRTRGLDLHADGIADIVGILTHKAAQTVFGKIFGIFFFFGVLFQCQDHVRASTLAFAGLDTVSVRTLRLPLPRLVRAKALGDHRDLVRDHEGRIEAHAELADDVDVLFLLHLLLEAERAAVGDGAEVLLHLLAGHADAVIGDGQGTGVLVGGQGNGEIAAAQADGFIRQRLIGQLIDRVGGVGDQLAEEDLPMGINRIDHQIKKSLGLCLELLLCHNVSFLCVFGFGTHNYRVLKLL